MKRNQTFALIFGIVLLGLLAVLFFKGMGRRYAPVPINLAMTETTAELVQESAGQPEAQPADQTMEETAAQAQTETETEPADETVHLLFGGDVLLSDHVLNAYDQAGGIRGVVDEGLAAVIEESDLFMVNQEFPFSERGTPAADKQFTFRLPRQRVSILQEMGIDLVTLANNHGLDFGREALEDTLDTLDAAGIDRVGAGRNLEEAQRPVIQEIKGKRIGFLGATRVIPEASWAAGREQTGMLATYDPQILLDAIRQAREECDFLVVYVHWGIEKDELPQDYQRTLGQQYIDAGADLVVGAHPHVLQGIEYYKGKPIVYSLGNFVFGSSIPRTALMKADWDGEQLTLTLVPATSQAGCTRMTDDQAKREEFDQYMTGISYGVTVSGGVCQPQP